MTRSVGPGINLTAAVSSTAGSRLANPSPLLGGQRHSSCWSSQLPAQNKMIEKIHLLHCFESLTQTMDTNKLTYIVPSMFILGMLDAALREDLDVDSASSSSSVISFKN